MTVPPNYGQGPGGQQPPGYGYGSGPDPQTPANGYGSTPDPQSGSGFGYQPGQSSGGYGGAPGPAGSGGYSYQNPYDPQSDPYSQPGAPQPPKKNLGMIGGIIIGVTVVVLGAILLVTLGLRGDEPTDDPTAAAGSESPSAEESTAPEEEESEPQAGDEVGQCLPYEPAVADDGYGDGLVLAESCDAEDAFWTITAQSYDVSDIAVDDEGYLVDNAPVYDFCGESVGAYHPGQPWTNWHYVYSSGGLDSLYCIEAIDKTNAESEGVPVTPTEGDCFDKTSEWWTVDCSSDKAVYEATGVVELDEPTDLSDEEAAEQATCGGNLYWELPDPEGRTTALLCGNEL
ncbi:hypothetical protein [Glycomyces buryatensis]|uniref:Uncharacterized protein n=1 Tax=Glycomyces buryatensis TaxID=2570927 RepID=A0A4V4HSG0_9ACTN|nr:hypothetical protein [Glycomyces buryatensis]THV41566.1 hypothetical protein FAB82_10680 [Glycomyces buryatensis]